MPFSIFFCVNGIYRKNAHADCYCQSMSRHSHRHCAPATIKVTMSVNFFFYAFTASLKLKYYFSDLFYIFITIRPYNCRNEEVFVCLRAVLETRQGIRSQSSTNFHGVYSWITQQHNLVTPTVCASRYTWKSYYLVRENPQWCLQHYYAIGMHQ